MYKLVDKQEERQWKGMKCWKKGEVIFKKAKENTIVMEGEEVIISDERDEELEDSTYIEVRKLIDKFIKHKAQGIDGITTELIDGITTTN
jgi:hypothetical protein